MKIGILTQPLLNNYGGLLQNYALQHVLNVMGHEVETVDWEPVKEGALKEWLYHQKLLMLGCFNKNVERPRYILNKAEAAVIGQNTSQFVKKYIHVCSQKARSLEDFANIDRQYKYNAYVVGSDQVWRPDYNSTMMPAMFLNFVQREDVKRIAYAASFGTDRWEFTTEMTKTCAQLAQKFDLITVREASGVMLCQDYLGVKAKHVLDPTMLLNKEDYVHLVIEEKEPESEGTLFHYILDPSAEKKTFIEKVAQEHGLKPFTIMPKCQAENRTKRDVKKHIEDCVFPSVTSWLCGFMDAKMVIVDSFHGAVFSIIFNKPFWVIKNNYRGNARFESLLGLYGLEDRLISIDNVSQLDMNVSVDWNRVNSIRSNERELCKRLLNDMLLK